MLRERRTSMLTMRYIILSDIIILYYKKSQNTTCACHKLKLHSFEVQNVGNITHMVIYTFILRVIYLCRLRLRFSLIVSSRREVEKDKIRF